MKIANPNLLKLAIMYRGHNKDISDLLLFCEQGDTSTNRHDVDTFEQFNKVGYIDKTTCWNIDKTIIWHTARREFCENYGRQINNEPLHEVYSYQIYRDHVFKRLNTLIDWSGRNV